MTAIPSATVIGALVLFAAARLSLSPATEALPPDRVYSAVELNRRPVPADHWFISTLGDHHWVRLDEAVLRLRADKTFRVSARYYRARRPSRTAPRDRVVMSENATGVYSIHGDAISLFLRPKNPRERATKVEGRIVGGELLLAHTIKDGTDRHRVTIRFRRNASIW